MSTRSSSPTIVDVARQAGVSIKTVSRVLNQEPGVHEETRAEVLRVVKALRYRPKQSARSLAGGRSFLLGLLYYDPSAAFVGRVQQGATLHCREVGYHLVVESLHHDTRDLQEQVERMVMTLRPDGMILTPPLCDSREVLDALRESDTPFVQISPERDLPDAPSLRMDDIRAAEDMTNLLISLGHERIAFIKGAPDQIASAHRYQGYLDALRAHGLQPDTQLIQQGSFSFDTGREAAHQLLSRTLRPTAVFASNDDMALGVLAAAQRLGLSVPGDLSVAGFDDSPPAALVWPALTTVRQPVSEMASLAVDLLVRRRSDPAAEPVHRVLPFELVVRDSTAVRRRG
ncbi:LacI family DNA-binding transcriptional regulator [Roseateles sp.]|uniref:LacI family DNA-binding transcriptional regulator n=1 Tax=Roseateles sp. TaxID=1971397 RepID=UPI0039590740